MKTAKISSTAPGPVVVDAVFKRSLELLFASPEDTAANQELWNLYKEACADTAKEIQSKVSYLNVKDEIQIDKDDRVSKSAKSSSDSSQDTERRSEKSDKRHSEKSRKHHMDKASRSEYDEKPKRPRLEEIDIFGGPQGIAPTQKKSEKTSATVVTVSGDSESESEKELQNADDLGSKLGLSCVVCGKIDYCHGNLLVECNECNALYHQKCHKPGIADQEVDDPRAMWYCYKCKKTMSKLASTKSSTSASSSSSAQKHKSMGINRSPDTSSNSGGSSNNSSSSAFHSKSKTDLAHMAFKRAETKLPVSSGVSSNQQPLTGLAVLAANINNTSKSSSTSQHSKPNSSKSGSSSTTTSSASKSGKVKLDAFSAALTQGVDSRSQKKSSSSDRKERSKEPLPTL